MNERLRDYHAAVWDEPVVMELGAPGRRGQTFPAPETEVRSLAGSAADLVPAAMQRSDPPQLPEMTEPEVQRHYLHLSQETLGMMGVSLFGTCTMKYNSRLGEMVAARPELAEIPSSAGGGDAAGRSGDHPQVRSDPARAIRHGPVHFPGRRRRRCKLHAMRRHPRLSRAPRRTGTTQRNHHVHPGPSL